MTEFEKLIKSTTMNKPADVLTGSTPTSQVTEDSAENWKERCLSANAQVEVLQKQLDQSTNSGLGQETRLKIVEEAWKDLNSQVKSAKEVISSLKRMCSDKDKQISFLTGKLAGAKEEQERIYFLENPNVTVDRRVLDRPSASNYAEWTGTPATHTNDWLNIEENLIAKKDRY